jgi:small subunit ribosomal protein S20
MPHSKSAKKNLRKSEKRRLRNRAAKRSIRTHLKRFLAAVDGPLDTLQNEYNAAAMKLDKAAARGVIHANLAARKKSQLARLMHKKKTAPPASMPEKTS